MKILLQNLQAGANISKGYWQFPFLFWRYFTPHSQKPIQDLSEYIKNEGVDAALFTEADAGSLRTRNINEVDLIAKSTGLIHQWFFPTVKWGTLTNQGNGIVSSKTIIGTQMHRLPGSGEARYLCHSTLQEGKNKIHLFVTHLSLSKDDRLSQLREINKILENTDGTKILTGDFNIDNESELSSITALKRVSFINTYPSWKPSKALDNIFVSENVKCSVKRADTKMSDHAGLIMEF